MSSFKEYSKIVQPTSLNYPTVTGQNQFSNVLLIDRSVPSYQTFVDSVNASTFPIVYSVTSVKADLLALLQTNFTSISRIGIVFTSHLGNTKMFLDRKPFFVPSESDPYSENMQFIIQVLKEFQVKNIDYLACNTLNDADWVNYYTILTQQTGVQVGASNDKTGNIKYGGDWIMESTSQDVELIYWTKNIEYYTYLLDNPPNIQTLKIIWNNDPTIYGLMTLDIANTISNYGLPTWIYNFTLNIQGTIFNFSDFYSFIYAYFQPIDYTQPNLLPQFDDFNFFTDTGNPTGYGPFQFIYNNNNGFVVSNIFLVNTTCFKEDTKILTDKGYLPIQDLRKGDLVKTLKHDFLPIEMIGKREIFHPAKQERIKDQLYIYSKKEEIFEDLIITGCHSVLKDWLTQEQVEKTMTEFGRIHSTDDKVRLRAYLDENASVYPIPGTYTIYHLALVNEHYTGNYGIYANGLLVETCSLRYLKELSNMELIE